MTETTVTPDHDPGPISGADLASIAEPSQPFADQWHRLISKTNWEKGRIISKWRRQLADAGVAPRLYSDPAWSRLVGEVSPQHTGRLRRTWERFGAEYASYEGLYWSHFFAALDWHDAEMWLEGAVQNRWSVSKMRFQRWEATGAVAGERPDPLEIRSTDDDEGVRVPPRLDLREPAVHRGELPYEAGPLREGPDFGDEISEDAGAQFGPAARSEPGRIDVEAILAELPRDMAGSFRKLRAAFARERDNNWADTNRLHLIALVNELRELLRKPRQIGE
jgi:hypothetical protein